MPRLKKGSVVVLVGTRKGGFICTSDRRRKAWRIEGPLFSGAEVPHFTLDPRDGTLFASTYTEWWGADVQRSRDGGRTWKKTKGGVRYPKNFGASVKRIWHVRPGRPSEPQTLYCGVDPAGLFRSDDGGATWSEVRGLNRHSTRKKWQPGAGGLCLHSIVLDPADERGMWVGISAVGVFRTDDGGRTWTPRNRGTRADFMPNKFPEMGQCVHKLLLAGGGGSQRLYQQNHCGVYRTDSGGDDWKDLCRGLPSRFGFPLGVHPADPDTAWVIPLEAAMNRVTPRGRLAVYRTRNAGRTWQAQTRGLPVKHAYLTILREAMGTDTCDPAGVYFGTTGGHLFYSRDEGRRWDTLAGFLPPVLSVEAAVVP